MKMPMRHLYLLLLALAVVIGLLVVIFHEPPEPSYGGKKLSEWVDGYPDPRVNVSSAPDYHAPDAAIRAIGADAVPWLLMWVRMRSEKPAPWKERLYERLTGVPWVRDWAGRLLRIEPWGKRFPKAVFALKALGPQ